MMKSKLARLVAIVTNEKFLNPCNLEEEKEKVLSNDSYDPQFEYPKLDYPAQAFKKDLERMIIKPQHKDPRINMLIQERARELSLWIDLMQARGSPQATAISKNIFGTVQPRHVQAAKAWLDLEEEEVEKTVSADEAVQRLLAELNKLGTGWSANVNSNINARVSVNALRKQLNVRAGEFFSEKDIQKLIVHEIKTHALRSIRGSEQDLDILEAGTARYLETEEGLAVFHEHEAGLLSNKSKKYIALKVMAIYWAMKEPFSAVYQHLLEYLTPEKAFHTTFRVKRGLSDTSEPGAFSKDLIYMAGYLKISSLSEQDRQNLMVGKVGVEQLPVIKELIAEGVIDGHQSKKAL